MTNQTHGPRTAAVVGSGASGLGAAHHLEKAGFDVDLLEREEVFGGRFGVSTLGDRPVMMGGKNIGNKYTTFRAFTADLGDHPYESFGYNSSRLKGDKIVTLDSSHRVRTLVNMVRMGSIPDLFRMVRLARKVRAADENRFLGSPLSSELGRRYDDQPISRHFSHKLTGNLLRPLTIRQTGAEPDEVYMGSLVTNVGALMDTYDQLAAGVQPVLEAFAERVNVELGTTVVGLVAHGGAVIGLRLDHGGTSVEERRYDAVVLATPAYVTRKIVEPTLPDLATRLDDVAYYPSTVALVEYDRPIFTHEVRALALDGGPCSNIGTYGEEDRHIARYTFSGRGARIPDPTNAQIQSWVDDAERLLARYVPFGAARRVRTITRHWPAAYCGYTPFHADFLAEVKRETSRFSGLELAGDYLRGVSIEACFRSGQDAAERVVVALGSASPSVAPVAR